MPRSKEIQQYKELYITYAPMLIRFARKFVSSAISEDIVHDVFIRVWEKKLFLLPEGEVKKIFYTAVRNACVDHLRKLTLEQKFVNQQALQLKLDELDFYNAREHLFMRDDLLVYVLKLVGKLPEKQKLILCLSYLEGLKSKEIAQQLNLSVRTIENQLYRSLLALRKKHKESICT